MRITIVAGNSTLEALGPLLRAYGAKQIAVQTVVVDGKEMPALQPLAEECEALLVVGPRRRSPRTVLPGPVLYRRDGAAVPAGWLPDTGQAALATFATAAARVHGRQGSEQPVALLSQWHPQYLKLCRRIEHLLQQQHKPVFRWSSDLLLREEMARGMRSGLAAALYVGHGRPIGWVGYRGTRIHHFSGEEGEPLGALLSLCCHTASRRRTGLSFAEAIALHGVAAAAFGAVGKTRHTDNTRWAVRLCTALQEGASNVGELVARALPPNAEAINSYRILGDPLAPLCGAHRAIERAQQIEVYP